MSENLFLQAAKQRLRFPSIKGEMTAEDLFQLPLTSKQGFDLDTIARNVNNELKAAGEESFVETNSNPARTTLALKLELVKFVIAERQAENAAKVGAAARQAEVALLKDILADKQNEALRNLPPEELAKRIAELTQ